MLAVYVVLGFRVLSVVGLPDALSLLDGSLPVVGSDSVTFVLVGSLPHSLVKKSETRTINTIIISYKYPRPFHQKLHTQSLPQTPHSYYFTRYPSIRSVNH